MVHDEDKFRIRPGKVRDRGDARTSARRIGATRGRSTSFVGEVHQAIRRAGGNPNRGPDAGKGRGRFNAPGRGAATALTLKDRSAWSRDGSGARTRARRVAVKARVVKLSPQRGAARSRQFVSAKAVDAHLRYIERDGVTLAQALPTTVSIFHIKSEASIVGSDFPLGEDKTGQRMIAFQSARNSSRPWELIKMAGEIGFPVEVIRVAGNSSLALATP
jgi:hypothetical protein